MKRRIRLEALHISVLFSMLFTATMFVVSSRMMMTSRLLDSVLYDLEDFRYTWVRLHPGGTASDAACLRWSLTFREWMGRDEMDGLTSFLGIDEDLRMIADTSAAGSAAVRSSRLENRISRIRNDINIYRMDFQSGFSAMIQAQILLVILLMILVVISFVERRRRKVERQAELRLQNDIARAQEHERSRLAFDLHDGVAQDLAWLRMRAGDTPEMEEELGRIQSRIRRMSEILKMPDFVRDSFDGAVKDLLLEFEAQTERHPLYIAFNLRPDRNVKVYEHAYRIIQEGLNNIAKHAGPCRAVIEIQEENGHLYLEIRDNGRGFPKEKADGNGLGFRGMKYRTTLLAGKMEIHSEEGTGSRLSFRIPLEGSPSE